MAAAPPTSTAHSLTAPRSRLSRRGRRTPPLAVLGSLAVAAALLAACGSSKSTTAAPAASTGSATDTGSSSGTLSAAQIAQIKADLASAAAIPTWKAGGPAFSAKNLAGKSVFLLAAPTNQFSQSFISGVKAAAHAVGMSFSSGGSADEISTQNVQDIDNAVTAKASVIIIEALDPATLSSAMVKAKAAGIPVIETFIGDPQIPPASEQSIGVYADATYCYSCTGKLSAEYEILRRDGKVDSVVQQFPGSPPSDATALGWKEGIDEFCPKTCTISYDNLTFGAQTTQQIQSGGQVAAQNPKVNALFPVYDYQMGFILPELGAANAANRIDLLSENADLAQMQEMASGTAVKVDVGNPVSWDGWGAMDEALRALEKLPPSANEQLPVRLFDTANVGTINLKADPGSWYGAPNYVHDYEQLWGVAS
jgi:ribose transport system substrate-binding protein